MSWTTKCQGAYDVRRHPVRSAGIQKPTKRRGCLTLVYPSVLFFALDTSVRFHKLCEERFRSTRYTGGAVKLFPYHDWCTSLSSHNGVSVS